MTTIKQRIGTSAYALVHYTRAQISTFLEKCRVAGATATEAFFVFTWDQGWKWQPYKIIGTYRKFDRDFPLFDLSIWNEAVWKKWEFIFKEAQARGLSLVIRILDFCSVKDDIEEASFCYRACHQRIDHPEGDPEHLSGGLWGIPIRAYYKKLIYRILELQKSTGVDLYLSLWNEADVVDAEEAWADAALVNQFKWFVDLVTKKRFPKDHVIINTSRAFVELRKLGCLMEIHGCNSNTTMLRIFNDFGIVASTTLLRTVKIIPNGDGPDHYATGTAGHNGYREPGLSQAYIMGKLLVKYKCPMYLYFNRSIEPTRVSNLRLAKFGPMIMLREGVDDAIGGIQ